MFEIEKASYRRLFASRIDVGAFMVVEGNAAFSMQRKAITSMLYQLPYKTSASNSVPLFNPLKITIFFSADNQLFPAQN